MKKIFVIVGARPNFMKVARFKQVASGHGIEVELVHTGQHTDGRMTAVFFEQFGLRPDHVLEIPDVPPVERLGHMIQRLGRLMQEQRPDAVVVVGDVDSTLAGALAANRCGIKLIHLEAGLRSGDMGMPEEVNRILVDRIADHLLITEPSARENLLKEGRKAEEIHFLGNTMIDALVAFEDRIEASPIVAELGLNSKHVLVTMHRPATVDVPERLSTLADILIDLAQRHQVVFPVHPRTRKRLEAGGELHRLQQQASIRLTEPLDHFAFQKLLATSQCVITDSGGVQEETTFRGVPCITLRDNTERPVTITHGTNRLVRLDTRAVRQALDAILEEDHGKHHIPELWDGHATERVFAVLDKVL